MIKRQRRFLNTEIFIKLGKQIHGSKYDYSKVNYKNANTNVLIICPIHGLFSQNPRSHLKGFGCAKCSNRTAKTTEDFIKESKQVHGDKYDYSETVYVNNHTNVKIFCKKDKIFFIQNPRVHLQGTGCPKCARNQKLTTEGFIERAIAIHGNKYDYSSVVYQSHAKKIIIICPIHGPFEQRANGHLNGKGCYKCAKSYKRSRGEIELCKFIKSIYSGQVLENDRTVIKPKELDIYLPELKLALEYNGEYWHDEIKKRKPGYHKEKQKACEKKGIKLIEVWDSEWHADKDRFKNLIQEVINSIRSPLKI